MISILFLPESIDNQGLEIPGVLVVWCWVNREPPPDPAPGNGKYKQSYNRPYLNS